MKKPNFVRGTQNLLASQRSGFTLIELLVVIAIIGLLASVVLVALNGARQKSRDAKRVADMNEMSKGLELFFNDAFVYPTGTTGASYTGGATLGQYSLLGMDTRGTSWTLTPTYMVSIPVAPLPADNTGAANCTSANNTYVYQASVTGSTYTITFCLGGTTGSLSPGIHYLTPGGMR